MKGLTVTERISQDPLENYFGKQRARGGGGRNENPNLQQCVHNAAALRVQKSMALDLVRGNCSKKRRLFSNDEPTIDETPLNEPKVTNFSLPSPFNPVLFAPLRDFLKPVDF